MKDIQHFGMHPKNYRFLLIGIGVNIMGYLLMIGGGAEDANTFDADALFDPIRITLSPLLILAGFALVFYAIMKPVAPENTTGIDSNIPSKEGKTEDPTSKLENKPVSSGKFIPKTKRK